MSEHQMLTSCIERKVDTHKHKEHSETHEANLLVVKVNNLLDE